MTIWDLNRQTEICTAQVAGITSTITFSPDGRFVAAGSTAGFVEIVDAATGEGVARLASHSHGITNVQWSPDGKRITTCAEDDTFRIWDSATAEELLVFGPETLGSRFAIWSPDGRRIATFSPSGMIRVLGSTQLTLPEITDSFQQGKLLDPPGGANDQHGVVKQTFVTTNLVRLIPEFVINP